MKCQKWKMFCNITLFARQLISLYLCIITTVKAVTTAIALITIFRHILNTEAYFVKFKWSWNPQSPFICCIAFTPNTAQCHHGIDLFHRQTLWGTLLIFQMQFFFMVIGKSLKNIPAVHLWSICPQCTSSLSAFRAVSDGWGEVGRPYLSEKNSYRICAPNRVILFWSNNSGNGVVRIVVNGKAFWEL